MSDGNQSSSGTNVKMESITVPRGKKIWKKKFALKSKMYGRNTMENVVLKESFSRYYDMCRVI